MNHFWREYIKHYQRDPFGMWFVILFGLASAGGVVYFMHSSPILFLLGYIVSDPLTFYFKVYRQEVLSKQIPVPSVGKQHKPMLEMNGKPIRGTKRCKYCGLNESYWPRFPDCPTPK